MSITQEQRCSRGELQAIQKIGLVSANAKAWSLSFKSIVSSSDQVATGTISRLKLEHGNSSAQIASTTDSLRSRKTRKPRQFGELSSARSYLKRTPSS